MAKNTVVFETFASMQIWFIEYPSLYNERIFLSRNLLRSFIGILLYVSFSFILYPHATFVAAIGIWYHTGITKTSIYVDNYMETITHNYKHPSPAELLDIFPDAVPAIKRNLKIWQKREEIGEKIYGTILDEALKNLHINYPENNEFKRKLLVPLAQNWFYNKPMQEIRNNVNRLDKLLRSQEWKRKPTERGKISDIDIARAKNFPLENIIKPNDAGFIKCPFHPEKTPSLKFYKDNRWHCFGSCNGGGDVIDFIMKYENIDFVSAVKKLSNK